MVDRVNIGLLGRTIYPKSDYKLTCYSFGTILRSVGRTVIAHVWASVGHELNAGAV